MQYLLTGGMVWNNGALEKRDVAIADGRIVSVSPSVDPTGYTVIELRER